MKWLWERSLKKHLSWKAPLTDISEGMFTKYQHIEGRTVNQKNDYFNFLHLLCLLTCMLCVCMSVYSHVQYGPQQACEGWKHPSGGPSPGCQAWWQVPKHLIGLKNAFWKDKFDCKENFSEYIECPGAKWIICKKWVTKAKCYLKCK